MHATTTKASMIDCMAATAAASGSFSPMRLATIAVAAMLMPIAREYTRVSIDMSYIVARRELFHQAAPAADLDHIHDEEWLIRNAEGIKHSKYGRLCAIRNLS